MATFYTSIILVVFCLLAGLLMGFFNLDLNPYVIIPILFVIVFCLLFARNLYIFNRSANMKEVKKLLHRYRKRPYLRFLMEEINGNELEAEKYLAQVKNDQQKVMGTTALYIRRKDFEQAKIENDKIKNEGIRHYNRALIALMEDDMEEFQAYKLKINRPVTKLIVETEEAYKKGNIEEAEKLGNQAISTAKGLQKYALINSLEREKKNPNRESYF